MKTRHKKLPPDAAANARNSMRAFIKDWREIRARVAAGVSMDCDESDWQRYFRRLWDSYRRAVADARVPAAPRPVDYQVAGAAHFFGMLQQATEGHGDRL